MEVYSDLSGARPGGNEHPTVLTAEVYTMFQYKGIACPHCGQEFKETDEILICPDCGAPYHRRCIQELGKCQFEDLHRKGENWRPPQKAPHEEETRYDSRASARCSRCGTVNDPDRLFCEVCGTPLNQAEEKEGQSQQGQQGGWQNFGGDGRGQPPFRQMAYNPYTTPFGGLNPDESIEDLPLKDLAIYVGQNTHYFLPKFKAMANRERLVSWNWAAFFFDSFYLLYRKMWVPGILLAVLSVLLALPNTIVMYSSFSIQLGVELPFSTETLNFIYNLSNVFYVISLGLKVACGAFTNLLYQRNVFRSVRELRAKSDEHGDYTTQLSGKGGVSLKALIICIAVTALFSILSSVLILRTMNLL